MELDAVEPTCTRAFGRLTVRVDDAVDILVREQVDGLPPTASRDLEEMDDLRDDLARPGVVDARGEVGKAGLEVVARNPQQRPALGAVHPPSPPTTMRPTSPRENRV